MSSEAIRPVRLSAAWRISLWGTLAFAFGTMVVFIFLHRFIANEIERRNDAWVWGEASLLADIAERTPKDALYNQIVGEIAELVRKQVPGTARTFGERESYVFFLQLDETGSPRIWIGPAIRETTLQAIRQNRIFPDEPSDLRVDSTSTPFRTVSMRIEDGSRIYLGLSERDELRILDDLRIRFILLWLLIVFLGFSMVFTVTRNMLGHVQEITDAASSIGQFNLNSRVPAGRREDEVGHLALTLNKMLDRIQTSVHQLHTMADGLAHDLRSPLTAIRGRLEMCLSSGIAEAQAESLVLCIEMLDRLSLLLKESLDVAEGSADALRLQMTEVDLNEVVSTLTDLYRPGFEEKSITVKLSTGGSARILGDAASIHRVISNLLDNELTHVPSGRTVSITLQQSIENAVLTVEDDGPGFSPELIPHLFDRSAKGSDSPGYGLGLAFVKAVVNAHRGTATASRSLSGGACLTLIFPALNVARSLPSLQGAVS